MKDASEKTNVMRLCEQKKLCFTTHHCENAEGLSGVELARALDLPEERMYKTLVTCGKSRQYYVFVIPVAAELDLKKAASAVGEKSIEMIKSKDLLPLTGYIHGGCSPIGMKKFFCTTVDESAKNLSAMIFSAGKIGYQVEMSPSELAKIIRFDYANLT